jgi:hypothetical protein
VNKLKPCECGCTHLKVSDYYVACTSCKNRTRWCSVLGEDWQTTSRLQRDSAVRLWNDNIFETEEQKQIRITIFGE